MVPLLKTNKEKNLKNNLIVLTDKCLCYFYLKKRKKKKYKCKYYQWKNEQCTCLASKMLNENKHSLLRKWYILPDVRSGSGPEIDDEP